MSNLTIAILLIALCLLIGGLIGSICTVLTLKQAGGINIKLTADKQFREVIDQNNELIEHNIILKESVNNLVQELCWCNNCLMCKHLDTKAESEDGACMLGHTCFEGDCVDWVHHILTDVELDYTLLEEESNERED